LKVDLRLPTPLLEPSLWPEGDDVVVSVFALTWGGPLFDRMKSAKSLTITAPAKVVASSNFDHVLSSALEEFPNAKLETESEAQVLSLSDWAYAVFPKTSKLLGEFSFRQALSAYEQSLKPDHATLDTLRYFPAFLSRHAGVPKPAPSEAALELANVTALFSPQADTQGSGQFVIANPTLEIVTYTSGDSDEMVAVARFNRELISKSLDWQEASVFDELRETPKTDERLLLAELEAKPFGLKSTRSFREVLSSLELQGFVLRRDA
jgi:hypothetical protein